MAVEGSRGGGGGSGGSDGGGGGGGGGGCLGGGGGGGSAGGGGHDSNPCPRLNCSGLQIRMQANMLLVPPANLHRKPTWKLLS